jgi:hypothetical protein
MAASDFLAGRTGLNSVDQMTETIFQPASVRTSCQASLPQLAA